MKWIRPKTAGEVCELQAIWSQKQAQEIDRASWGETPALTLMEQAGHSLACFCLSKIKLNDEIVVLAGRGNNGGDALVAARLLFEWGAKVKLICSEKGSQTVEHQHQMQELENLKIPLEFFDGEIKLAKNPNGRRILIDGLIGLGLKGPLKEGPNMKLLKQAKLLDADLVIAVDIPSGLMADYFDQEPALLAADFTISFGAPKAVHVLAPSCSDCGEVVIKPIDFSHSAILSAYQDYPQQLVSARRKSETNTFHLAQTAHKFDRGHVLVIGGDRSATLGATILASRAAYALGAGWVSLMSLCSEHNKPIPDWLVELTDVFSNRINQKKLVCYVREKKVRAIIIGPGCKLSPIDQDTLISLAELSEQLGIYIIIDAAALHRLYWRLKRLGGKYDFSRFILTPHPGEWLKIDDIFQLPSNLEDLEYYKTEIVDRLGINLVFKSATPIALCKSDCQVSSHTCPALARAGSGDMYTGVLAALLLREMKIADAIVLAHQLLVEAARLASLSKNPELLGCEDILVALGCLEF